jgi:hypothetical protein
MRDLPFGDLATIFFKKLLLRSFFFCASITHPLHRAASTRDTLRDMSREMARVGLIEEMQDDLFEGMADSDEEEEAEAEIERVMAEVLGEAGRAGVAAPKVRWRVWRLLSVLSWFRMVDVDLCVFCFCVFVCVRVLNFFFARSLQFSKFLAISPLTTRHHGIGIRSIIAQGKAPATEESDPVPEETKREEEVLAKRLSALKG